jgi:hypothetical protein
MSRLSDVVNSILERALSGECINPRIEAVAHWDDIDPNGQYMAGIEGVIARLRKKTKEFRDSASARISTDQNELPFSLPSIVAMDLDGRELRATRTLRRDEFVRAIAIREEQIKADAAQVREWKKGLTTADPMWFVHPEWDFGMCLDAIAMSVAVPEFAK